jgi:hypothetical protein
MIQSGGAGTAGDTWKRHGGLLGLTGGALGGLGLV